ncbi:MULTISPECIES: DUF5673 domain-containing protein [unclassified Clostridium]|uniref:DUF5673 domain-containing protein n=1 Tax=unclassified Clostridium TaxID=2614128 RepID=UPI0002986D83|nr:MULTISPECIES: DUF5673 domain-containing protein [unclassified Clostridium]EKQ56350.1 MAG: hypothetical protein A370_02106 [Clostridium sp. Maddingley MBC34-26]
MEIANILLIILVFIIDVVLIIRDMRRKLIFTGARNKYKMLTTVAIIVFLIYTYILNSFKLEDIIVILILLPLIFVGNKNGIVENGFLFNSYVTSWDKVLNYSLEEQNNKYIVSFKTSLGIKKIFFKLEDKEEIKKYLFGIRKLKYIRK